MRNIRTGLEIPSENYADQPYIVVTKDGNWLCTLTTGKGREGSFGQHVVCTVSKDKGKTWSQLIDIEPADGPEASWVMPLITPSGRVYAFYDYNGDNVRKLPSGKKIRADMLGWYCYKYSDDNGRTWSRRYRLPVRVTACDRANDWAGSVQIFWGIGKPIVHDSTMYFAFTKLGKYMLDDGEGWFFRSRNVLTESDPAKIKWQMLPSGEHGLRWPKFGSVQEEHNIVALANGDLYCMYRTTTGHPVHAYSRDGGKTWTRPKFASYAPNGRLIKHPRACPRIWKTGNGKYLFWFHNHGGKSYQNRNPAWLAGGIEKDGRIYWSQPEIILYDPDEKVRISYPDLIEQDGRYWITETQKETARVHEIDASLLEGLWSQFQGSGSTEKGLVLSLDGEQLRSDVEAAMKRLGDLDDDGGFTIEMWVRLSNETGEEVILTSRDNAGTGLQLSTTESGTIELSIGGSKNEASWDCDKGLLEAGKLHHVVFIVDGGPDIISCVVDGRLCDGGIHRQYGWGRFSDEMGDINSAAPLRIPRSDEVAVKKLNIYNRYLRTSEAIANYKAGRP